jgi:3-oxoacyl-[acyl-carrier-protein] synthase-3
MGTRITGIGSYVPETCVTNDDLAKRVGTSDKWIVQRTGIRTRFLLRDDELPSEMGVAAGRRALERAGVSAGDVDLLLVATNFPDMICPGSSPFIAEGLELGRTPFLDLKAGCTGFVYGLAIADGLLRSRAFRRILLIGTEALSRVTDWEDRRTCVLFGDGAGAVVLEHDEAHEGVLGTALFGDPEKTLLLHLPGGGTRMPVNSDMIELGAQYLKMEGSGVFRHAVPMMEKATYAALEAAEVALSDVDWVIPHQANSRIVDSLVRRLRVPPERVIVNLDRVANTSTASIPIAFDEARRDGRIKDGDLVVMTAFGAGVTYGAVVMRI